MSDKDLEELAERVADKLRQHNACCLTTVEQEDIRGLLKTKKKAAKTALWVFGLVLVWILRDAYDIIALVFKAGVKALTGGH